MDSPDFRMTCRETLLIFFILLIPLRTALSARPDDTINSSQPSSVRPAAATNSSPYLIVICIDDNMVPFWIDSYTSVKRPAIGLALFVLS